jgi:hypothetical protein
MQKITLRVTAMNDDMEFLKTKRRHCVYFLSVNERLFSNAKQYFKYWFNPTIVYKVLSSSILPAIL